MDGTSEVKGAGSTKVDDLTDEKKGDELMDEDMDDNSFNDFFVENCQGQPFSQH